MTADQKIDDLEWCAREEIRRINACETYSGALLYIKRYEEIATELYLLRTGMGRLTCR